MWCARAGGRARAISLRARRPRPIARAASTDDAPVPRPERDVARGVDAAQEEPGRADEAGGGAPECETVADGHESDRAERRVEQVFEEDIRDVPRAHRPRFEHRRSPALLLLPEPMQKRIPTDINRSAEVVVVAHARTCRSRCQLALLAESRESVWAVSIIPLVSNHSTSELASPSAEHVGDEVEGPRSGTSRRAEVVSKQPSETLPWRAGLLLLGPTKRGAPSPPSSCSRIRRRSTAVAAVAPRPRSKSLARAMSG